MLRSERSSRSNRMNQFYVTSGSVPHFTASPTLHPPNPHSVSQAHLAHAHTRLFRTTGARAQLASTSHRHQPATPNPPCHRVPNPTSNETRPRRTSYAKQTVFALLLLAKTLLPPPGRSARNRLQPGAVPPRPSRAPPRPSPQAHSSICAINFAPGRRRELREASCSLSKGKCGSCKAQRTRPEDER